MRLSKPLKIIIGVIIFFTLPSLLLFGFAYFKYGEPLPAATQSEAGDAMAKNMLKALNYEAFQNTNIIEWTHKRRRHYKWNKEEHTCTVYWQEYKVDLDLSDYNKSKCYVHNFRVEGDTGDELLNEAISFYENDSFWLVAPYTVFDEGVTRHIATLEDGSKGLLVTYSPEEAYVWKLDANGFPKSLKMWTDQLPFGGIEMSWNDWTTTESGAQLPTFHKFMVFGIQLNDVVGTK
ncbi:hypothetical protein [Mangrovimonas sp. YM274]|uniref:hypothetical protein n=1 Tax=Mangrovimonas sp. YM274 TaxID=3070660 RepID=UPI0027DE5A86|nr:hypothetical protein [Mangrovimonas sp. YM274]WMI70243.1 hypothetical protein RBH95_07790 [Mangrovimonas sp. YM274]